MTRIHKIMLAFITVISVCGFSSCQTYLYNEATARYVEPERVGFITPIAADMQISKEVVTHSENIPNTLKRKDIKQLEKDQLQGIEGAFVTGWKRYVLAQAMKKYNADDIISLVFDIVPSADATYFTVTVIGHPATFINYRKATKEDVELMEPFYQKRNEATLNTNLLIKKSK